MKCPVISPGQSNKDDVSASGESKLWLSPLSVERSRKNQNRVKDSEGCFVFSSQDSAVGSFDGAVYVYQKDAVRLKQRANLMHEFLGGQMKRHLAANRERVQNNQIISICGGARKVATVFYVDFQATEIGRASCRERV